MIQVQIASRLSPLGVEGVRWVLVDPSDAASAEAPTPAALLAAAHASPGDPADEGSLLSMALLKLLLTGLGLVAALWAAQGWLGEPTAAALAPLVGPALKPVAPAAALPSTPGPTPVPGPAQAPFGSALQTPISTPDLTPAEAIPMPNPLLSAPPEASPVTARDAAHDAPGWAPLAMPALPRSAAGSVANAPVLGPLMTAELR